MCVTATAKRRRKQAKMGYTHIAKRQRPSFAKRDEGTAERREAVRRSRQNAMQQRMARK